jgi:hypothetical protein
MKSKVLIILLISVFSNSIGQNLNHEKRLADAREFMKMVFDMQSLDSISKLTTLNKGIPLNRFKYCEAYFSITILRLQIAEKEFPFAELSYVPYEFLPQNKRTLVYEKFIAGIPNEKNFWYKVIL